MAQGSAADLVITASMAGMVTSPYSAVYAASKAGAIALAKSLRAELAIAAPSVRVALFEPGNGQDQPHANVGGTHAQRGFVAR